MDDPEPSKKELVASENNVVKKITIRLASAITPFLGCQINWSWNLSFFSEFDISFQNLISVFTYKSLPHSCLLRYPCLFRIGCLFQEFDISFHIQESSSFVFIQIHVSLRGSRRQWSLFECLRVRSLGVSFSDSHLYEDKVSLNTRMCLLRGSNWSLFECLRPFGLSFPDSHLYQHEVSSNTHTCLRRGSKWSLFECLRSFGESFQIDILFRQNVFKQTHVSSSWVKLVSLRMFQVARRVFPDSYHYSDKVCSTFYVFKCAFVVGPTGLFPKI